MPSHTLRCCAWPPASLPPASLAGIRHTSLTACPKIRIYICHSPTAATCSRHSHCSSPHAAPSLRDGWVLLWHHPCAVPHGCCQAQRRAPARPSVGQPLNKWSIRHHPPWCLPPASQQLTAPLSLRSPTDRRLLGWKWGALPSAGGKAALLLETELRPQSLAPLCSLILQTSFLQGNRHSHPAEGPHSRLEACPGWKGGGKAAVPTLHGARDGGRELSRSTTQLWIDSSKPRSECTCTRVCTERDTSIHSPTQSRKKSLVCMSRVCTCPEEHIHAHTG